MTFTSTALSQALNQAPGLPSPPWSVLPTVDPPPHEVTPRPYEEPHADPRLCRHFPRRMQLPRQASLCGQSGVSAYG